jgi:hypothetical protein
LPILFIVSYILSDRIYFYITFLSFPFIICCSIVILSIVMSSLYLLFLLKTQYSILFVYHCIL